MLKALFTIPQTLLNRRTGMIFGLILSLTLFAGLSSNPVAAGDCGVPKNLPQSSGTFPTLKCEQPVAPVETDDVCVTTQTRIAINDRNIVSIFSNFVDGNPNGMLITEIPLSAIRAVSDEEKATNQPILVLSKDSEFAPGFHVDLYWFDNHYGVVVTGSNSFYDDTANCAGF